jgi:hypothetical protein
MKKPLPPKPRAGRLKGIFGIDDAEWDFCERTIPSNSLHECLLYEYARELIRRSPEASITLKKVQAADCSGNRGLFWDSYQKMNSCLKTKHSGSVLVYPYMDEVPWILLQRQLEKERQEIIKRKKRGSQCQSVRKAKKEAPVIVSSMSETEETNDLLFLGKGVMMMSLPPIDRGIMNDSGLRGSVGKLFTKFDFRSAILLGAKNFNEQSNGFFAVDLKARIPDVLADFEAWLVQEKKRAGIVDPERRGRTSKTDKAYGLLRALGAFRLMTMTQKSAQVIIDTFHHRLKRPPLYSYAPEWSRAKKTVEATLRDLFVIPADAIF